MRNITFLFVLIPSFVLANDYQDGAVFGETARAESAKIMQGFDKNSLPDYSDNPKEQTLAPTARGELLQKGKQFITQDKEASYTAELAKKNAEQGLSEKEIGEFEKAIEAPLQDKVACDSGDCLSVTQEQSNDMAKGLTSLAALADIANGVKSGDVHDENAPSLFVGSNYTCRERYKTYEWVNYCKRENFAFWSANEEEKALHRARKSNLAIRVPGGNYCSRKKKKYGKRRCIQRKQSWCVFESRLAFLVQQEARRQLGFGFGNVGGDSNNSNCRGLSAYELSQIDFDSPQMQSALSSLFESYKQRARTPSKRPGNERLKDGAKAAGKRAEDAINLERDYV